jgi:hypothetical protein
MVEGQIKIEQDSPGSNLYVVSTDCVTGRMEIVGTVQMERDYSTTGKRGVGVSYLWWAKAPGRVQRSGPFYTRKEAAKNLI